MDVKRCLIPKMSMRGKEQTDDGLSYEMEVIRENQLAPML